ncbi:MAG: PaaI family thioesterase [Rhodobacteraceae bacterium]|nr:PaaI family thioesterase [Paracoccaceae bacterium]MCW9042391.1 PaaI family thioesterase [Pseudopelagicola sp.]
MALSPEIMKKIQTSFAAQTMMDSLGARLESVEQGHVVITSDIRPTCLQQHGFGHAGLTFSIGDTAAGYAALSIMPPDAEVLTTEMKIHLLAPAKGTSLRAVGRVIKPGRRLVITQADVYARDEAGAETHIALLTGTMFPVLP